MKKSEIVYIIVIVLFAVIIIVNKSSFFKKFIEKKDNNVYREVLEILKPVYEDYNINANEKYNSIYFVDHDDNEVEYHFYDNKISSVNIRYNLEKWELSSDELIENIEEYYQFATGTFDFVKNYFDDQFLFRDEYYINDHDKSYIKDLLDYNVEYSTWNVGYDYKEGNRSIQISYYLLPRYDHEGYSYFMIYIS